jgi:hypothetical protein
MSAPGTAAAPFTFIATYGVAEGHEEPLAELATAYVAELDDAEPRTHALGLYFDDERGTFTHVQMLADSAAMEQHMAAIQDYLARAADHVWIRSIDVYGEVGPRLRAALDHNAGAGAALMEHVGPAIGFGRSAERLPAGA